MRSSRNPLFLLAPLACLTLPAVVSPQDSGPVAEESFAAVPRSDALFVENRGQWPAHVRYVAGLGTGVFSVGETSLDLDLSSAGGTRALVRLEFEGAPGGRREIEAQEGSAARFHFLVGPPERWQRDVRAYERLRMKSLYEGVDLILRRGAGMVEYDLDVAPGVPAERIVVVCHGVDGIEILPDGSLLLRTAAGNVAQTPPIAWIPGDGGEDVPVRCRFRKLDERRYGFEVEGRDAGEPLLIDPGVEWSSYLGGSSWESAYGAFVDDTGAVTVVGQTGSHDFPTTPGAYAPSYSGVAFSDAFVTRVGADGALIYSTFVGGTNGEQGDGVFVDALGRATVVGTTSSSNFPTTPGAFDTQLGGSSDIFLLRLDPTGSALEFSTFIGGSSGDAGAGVIVASDGTATLVGTSSSADFPTPGGFDTTIGGSSDAVVCRVAADGSSLLFGTFLGGSAGESGMGIAAGPAGRIAITGATSSADFPVTAGAYDVLYEGNSDAYLAVLDPAGALDFATFLGGSGGDVGESVAVDPGGAFTVAGVTSSPDFPTSPGAFDSSLSGTSDVFVARLDPSGASLLAGTLLGGSSGDVGKNVTVDASGAATVSGVSSSSDFPVTAGAFDATSGGSSDAFVSRVSADASKLVYSTFVGGGSGDVCEAMGAHALGWVVISGTTSSSDFPVTPGAFDPSYKSPSESYVTRLSMLPAGVERFGVSTPACSGPIAIGIDTQPVAGGGPFGITCVNAPPGAAGFLAVSLGGSPVGLPVLGVLVHVSFFTPFQLLPSFSDAAGSGVVSLQFDPAAQGVTLYGQFAWLNTAACGGAGTFSASNALQLTLQ